MWNQSTSYIKFNFFLSESKLCCHYKQQYIYILLDRIAVDCDSLAKPISKLRWKKEHILTVEPVCTTEHQRVNVECALLCSAPLPINDIPFALLFFYFKFILVCQLKWTHNTLSSVLGFRSWKYSIPLSAYERWEIPPILTIKLVILFLCLHNKALSSVLLRN